MRWRPLVAFFLLFGVADVVGQAQPSAAPPGTSSLTFVFDKTGSMYDDLVQVREGAKKIFATVLEQREKLIYNYVLVPFHDPEVGPAVSTTDPLYFQRTLNNVYVQGGGDCPEMSITGIKMALETALPASLVYVFTDARSKDYHLEEQVLNLIQEKQSSVVFVMTGDCGNRSHPGFRVYEKIAAASFGQIFHLEKSDVNAVLEYVRYAIAQRKVHIMYEVRDVGGTVVRVVPVDSYLTELTLSLSGDKDDGDYLDITLIDPSGKTIDRTEYSSESGSIDLDNVKLLRIKNPKPGNWRVRTSSRLKHTIRVFGHGAIDFKYGFTSRLFDSIERAHPRPVSNQNTHLMVNMTGLLPPGICVEIALVDYYGKELYASPATINKNNPYLYHVGPFIPPKGLFFVRVKGEDDKGYEFQRIAPTAVSVVEAGGPRAYMAERTTAFRSEPVNLTCSVESRVPYTLYWYKGTERIAGPLFYSYSDTAYWTLPEVTLVDRGEYSCEVTSAAGNHSAATFLETREPPPHIVASRNVSVTLGTTAHLHCRTQTVGLATITWQRRGVSLRNTDHLTVFPNGTLSIHPASRADDGAYTCHVVTEGGDAAATIFLTVMEPPKASVNPQSLYFVQGGSFNISCYVTGDPQPEPQWFFNGRRVRPEGDGKYYITYKYDLIVRNAATEDAGRYECRATSTGGVASDYADVQLAVKPEVTVTRDRQMIGRGDRVVLECLVTAGFPTPTMTWFRGGREITAFRYISIEGGRLTIQGAQDTDAGTYTCVADNIAGRAQGQLIVDVGSIPSIVPSPETVRINIERTATLQCRATGHPTPEISWQKNGVQIVPGGRFTILPDGGLMIQNAQMDDQTRYTCTATNTFGRQDHTVMVMITGLISPVLGHVPPEEQLLEGRDLRLSCIVVLGTPKPTLRWVKNGQPVHESPTVVVEGGGSGLVLRNGNPSDEGQYTCIATNAAGNATVNINVQLISKPTIADDPPEYLVNTGERLEIPCRASGRPTPALSWTFEGRPLLHASAEYMIQPQGSILIHRTNINHGGMYVCTATNSAGETRRAVRVKVLTPPIIVPAQTAFNLIQGKSITLPCEATGDPKPVITWYLDEKPFTDGSISEDGSLTIQTASDTHRGQFKCIATNNVGSDERSVALTVHTAPVIDGSGEMKTITVNVNETVRFPCPARADPPPSRSWTYEGREVFRGYSFGSELRFTGEGTLEILTAQMQHAGRYVCKVSNLAGDDSITYQLKVRDPPRIISDIAGTLDVVLGLILEIPCRAIGTPQPTISWEKDGFQILSDNVIEIDPSGTLRIEKSQLSHAGEYKCTASNPAGTDMRVTTVVVQEPPVILPSTPADYTAVENDKVEMFCYASGSPPPEITWMRRGAPIVDGTVGIQLGPEQGKLTIKSVQNADHGPYICKASNAAGSVEKDVKLTVIVPPDIPDQGKIIAESVLVGGPFSLYCPVFSTPIPEITWHLNNRPIAESDANVQLSDDKRRLHILKSRTTDAGVYKCIARNPAGESTKTFEVEVLVPPNLDEGEWKRKVSVIQNNSVVLGCPVSGIPDPDISWLVNGQLMKPGSSNRGVKLSDDGKTIVIESAQLDHEGEYTCVATNKAGTLDIDVELTVLAPPSLGDDETIEVIAGLVVTMNCNPKQEGLKSTVTWLVDGSPAESSSANVQVALGGRRLYVMEAQLPNQGTYQCIVRNSAGENRKNFKLIVLVPPEFRDRDFEQNIEVNEGNPWTLMCHVTGSPTPEVTWQRDGRPITDNSAEGGVTVSENNQVLRIEHVSNGQSNHRYTCQAKNKAGAISRDFFVQIIAPPEISQDGDRTVIEVFQGSSATLECPVSVIHGVFELQWLREGRPLPADVVNMQISLDRTRLVMVNVQKADETIYTCVARNPAGEATREFQLIVLVPPKILGKLVEDITVVEGQSFSLNCEFDADPDPQVSWLKDGRGLRETAELINRNTTVYVSAAEKEDAGSYFCSVKNKAGMVEKTFNVRVLLKPEIRGSDEVSTIEVLVTTPITLDCPVNDPIGVDLSWSRHEIPVVSGMDNIQLLAGGRHLHIGAVKREDAGPFTCVAKNAAGQSSKKYKLVVLVPPTIIGDGGAYTVIENNSLVLPCEVEGIPMPTITWTKEGSSATVLPSVELLSEGQQLKIVNAASDIHRGGYVCTATNKVGTADLGFDVDVISKPSVSQSIKDTIEVIKGDSANFRCPITDKKFRGDITWLRDYQPLPEEDKYIVAQSGLKLHLPDAQPADEGSYSCRLKNDAGESRVDFKLVVLVPPEIIMLDKDKNRTVIENTTLTLSCPATGKPDPTIEWLKDGERLTTENVGERIASAQLIGNELRIAITKVPHSGRYTCEAKNKAGLAEQDVTVYVMTAPRIEREGIPSEIDGVTARRVTMSCPAYGRPMPTVTWLKAGRPLDDSADVYFSANGQKLHFLSLNKEHIDHYTCVARNAAGEDKRDFSLRLLEAPTIAGPNIPRKVQVNVGRAATLNCPATGSPEPTISWLKNGQPLEAGGNIAILAGGKQLQISNAQLDDDARYTCIATNAIGAVDLDTFVEVVGGPKIAGDQLETVEVIVNQASDLTCEITGTEPLDVEWQRGGQTIDVGGIRGGGSYLQISSRGRKLHLLSAQVADTSRYTCVARNTAGEARKSFDLRVLVPPNINDTLSSKPLQTIIPDSQFRIECKVHGIPQPEIVWRKDDQIFYPGSGDDRVQLMHDNQTIWVRTAAHSDAGRYTCEATNKVGKASKDYIVRLTAPPTVDKGTVEMEVLVGDYVILTCQVTSGTGQLNVKWLINERPVDLGTLGSTVSIEDRRIEIREARLSDTSKYTCVVENEAGQAKKTFELTVLEPPRFLDTTNLSPSIILGRPLVLDCSVAGTPKPTIAWTKNGRALGDSDGRFTNERQQFQITAADEDDAGRYSCVAENKAGRADKDLVVAVLMPPTVHDAPTVIEIPENETQTIECPANELQVEIVWTRNGVPFTTSDNLQLSAIGRKLHIMKAQVMNAGRYSCIIKNDAGQVSADVEVIVLVPPRIVGPGFRTIDSIVNQTVQIECRTTGIPTPQVSWSHDGRPLLAGPSVEMINNGSVLRITAIQSAQEGRYTCTAVNKIGRAEADTFVQVTAPPQISPQPEELRAILGQGQTIRCEVSGSPPPRVEWLKNGQKFESALAHASFDMHYIHVVEAGIDDGGRYTCIATNRAGEDRITVQLVVLVPPTIQEGERVLNVKENTSLSLECIATGTPAPLLTWKREGETIVNGEHYQLVGDGQRLTILDARKGDAGRYTCQAKNEAGSAAADFAVDVYVRPTFRDLKPDVRVIEGDRARLECKVDAHPPATIRWLRGGRPIEDMSNAILSPRGESLMILKARRTDAGSYSCVAKNAAGESEAGFAVTVLVAPHIDEQIDQNPKVVVSKDIVIVCPVQGIRQPTVEWRVNGKALNLVAGRFETVNDRDLKVIAAETEDAGRYTCHASNEAGELDTDYALEVIAPPKFGREGSLVYEVIEGNSVTMDCAVEATPKPEIVWHRGDAPVYLDQNVWISANGQELTISQTRLVDGGKYVCKATNVAGTTDIDIILKVLVPPSIDKSNIIGNPLAIVNRTIFLECPVTGIPQPTVRWLKDGQPLTIRDARITVEQNNQTLGIQPIVETDEGRYTCVAESNAGTAEQDFNLEVLTPPILETLERQKITKREGDSLTLNCPLRQVGDQAAPPDVSWTKDGRPLDPLSLPNIRISSEGRRLHVTNVVIPEAGLYTCVASNRAGESSLEFDVEVLSPPQIDGTRNDPQPRVIIGRPMTLWCLVSGHPFPTVKWLKDGDELTRTQLAELQFIDESQGLQIQTADQKHAGRWTCVATNEAGRAELELPLDVWVPPTVSISGEDTIRPLQAPIVLLCQAAGNPTPTLSWTKAGQPLLTSASGARISGDGGRLDIPRLRETDVGSYTCSARNEAGTAEASVSIDVLVPPLINRDNVEMNPRLPTGQTLILTCEATGKPTPELAWFRDDTPITASNGGLVLGPELRYLQIANISLTDNAVYKCTASNTAGKDEILYSVDVVKAPLIETGGTLQVVEGEAADLECTAAGEPLPEITWQRNGIRVETGDRYVVDGRKLRISQSRNTDAGIYVCVATNEAGTAQQAYTLEVLVPPKIHVVSPDESVVPVGGPFSLKCGARGYPDPSISWSVEGEAIVSGRDGYSVAEDGTLFVIKASDKKSLSLKCVAKNDAGKDEKEYVVKTISPPTITKEGIKTINTTEGEPTLVVCEVEGEVPDVVWHKDGAVLAIAPNVELSEDETQLKIGYTRLSDEGLYACVAKNPAGNATQKFQLYVGVPPRITEKPRRVVVQNGEMAELWCEALGVPEPHITWLKDDVAIAETSVESFTDKRVTTAAFKKVEPGQAGVYTCKAENWAGTSYKDVDLVVLIPPAIIPERMNITAKLRDTVMIPCNATGIPEPVVSWYKEPNIDIVGNGEKFQILGTSLAIRDVREDDDSFYRCVAKSKAGVAIGFRKLDVDVPKKDWKVIWVECDENGNPVRTTYVPARGDLPDDDNTLLPWRTEFQELPENGTDGVIIRCLPGPRGPRRVPIQKAPHFVELPKSSIVALGATLEMTCGAVGPPAPTIVWLRNGQALENASASHNGKSVLKIVAADENHAGNYACVARNEFGSTSASATVRVSSEGSSDNMLKMEKSVWTRQVAVLSCIDKGVPVPAKLGYLAHWTKNGRSVASDEQAHILLNGSLVVFEPEALDPIELEKYHCSLKSRQHMVSFSTQMVTEVVPEVIVFPKRTVVKHGESIFIHCTVNAEPLTTKIEWTRNDVAVVLDARTFMHVNNTLEIRFAKSIDRAHYKCRASNRAGQAWDGAEVIVDDTPKRMVGYLEGTVNNIPLTNQAIYANMTPHVQDNSIYVKIDALPINFDGASRAMVGYITAPCWQLAYAPNSATPNGMKATNGNFERQSQYRFLTGERLTVKQTGRGSDAVTGYLTMDVLVDGRTPRFNRFDSVGMDPVQERYVQESPGVIRGFGRSTLRVGPHYRIPVEWDHNITYDAQKGQVFRTPAANLHINAVDLTGKDGFVLEAHQDTRFECPPGFHQEPGKAVCRDIDECGSGTAQCQPGQDCLNTLGAYQCLGECTTGYRLKLDGSCVDTDECALGVADCLEGQQCVNTDGYYECLDQCAEGYERAADGSCHDIDECADDHQCAEGQTCVNALGSYHCVCSPGSASAHDPACQGTTTNQPLRPTCPHNCVRIRGTFKCFCPTRMHSGSHHKRRGQPWSHQSSHHTEWQDNGRTVRNFPATSRCPTGLVWTGFQCEDMDECSFNSPCQFRCENSEGSYKCHCPYGYRLGADGHSCQDIDECQEGTASCSETALCFNGLGSFQCIESPCPPTYALDRDAKVCRLQCGDDCPPEMVTGKSRTIELQLVALPSGISPMTDLLRLTAYDSQDRVLHQTRFNIRNQDIPLRHTVLPFSIRLEGGRGLLYNTHLLQTGSKYRLGVRASSISDYSGSKYQTDFIVFLSVSHFPF